MSNKELSNEEQNREAVEALAEVEGILDEVAEEHKDHDCGTSEIALRLSAGVKMKREKLAAGSGGPAQVATKSYRRTIFISKGGDA
jgi:hypothetical protein